jgi:hypothetical protein
MEAASDYLRAACAWSASGYRILRVEPWQEEAFEQTAMPSARFQTRYTARLSLMERSMRVLACDRSREDGLAMWRGMGVDAGCQTPLGGLRMHRMGAPNASPSTANVETT